VPNQDATIHKIREGGRVSQVATVVAVGVSEAGHRNVLGVDTGSSDDHAFWMAFLRSPVKRGLRGVRLAISDPRGLRQAIAKVLGGATWQRCAGSTSYGTCSPPSPRPPRTPSRRFCGPFTSNLTTSRRWPSCMRWPRCSADGSPGRPNCSKTRRGPACPPALLERSTATSALDEPARAAAQGDQATDETSVSSPTAPRSCGWWATLLHEQDNEWQVAERCYFSVGSMARIDRWREVRVPESS
jgi:hypothetical protein